LGPESGLPPDGSVTEAATEPGIGPPRGLGAAAQLDPAMDGETSTAVVAPVTRAAARTQTVNLPVVDAGTQSVEIGAPGGAPVSAGTRTTLRQRTPSTASGTIQTPEDALRMREIRSLQQFLWIVVSVVAAVGLALPFLNPDPVARGSLIIGLALVLAGVLRTFWVLRTPERYRDSDALVLGLTAVAGAILGFYYFGYFSPAPFLGTMGIFFFSLVRRRAVAFTVYLAAALLQAIGMMGTATGLIADRSVIKAAGLPVSDCAMMLFLVEAVFFATYALGRSVADAMRTSLEELDRAVREVAFREALLDEARRDLESALKVGGPGRFSDQSVGDYRLGILCGRGAMGDVYRAEHVHTGQVAAVKLLHRHVLANPKHLRRFLREARIAASLDVENVVKVLDVGEDTPVPFLVMEYLQGQDLAHILRVRGRLDADEVLELLEQIGRGVDAAHAAGVVHRDLKPQNLFCAERSGGKHVWKVLDFGVSRLIDTASTLTEGRVIGTPAYMAPEQARGQEVDHRADLFSLAALVYRALLGRPAFSGKGVPQLLHEVVYSMPPKPSAVADVPESVDAVFAVALAKEPGDRFDSAAQLGAALRVALTAPADDERNAAVQARSRAVLGRHPWRRRR
jgi:serine/threonine-protein kinase